jgi:hypothetical protein
MSRSNNPFTPGMSSSSSAATFSESLRPRVVAVTSVTFHSWTMDVVKVFRKTMDKFDLMMKEE